MNTCESIQRQILLAESGELEEARKGPLADHLAACPACRLYQRQTAWIGARAPRFLEGNAPLLDPAQLDIRARQGKHTILRLPVSLWLGAVAALFLAFLGARYWLTPAHSDSNGTPPHRLAMLDEWQFWMVSYAGPQAEESTSPVFGNDWNEGEFARHLLVLEGLLPEEEAIADEDLPGITPGELPPITLREYSIRGLLRS